MGIDLSSSINGIQSALVNNNVRSNNIANINSHGYKSRRAVQTDSGTGGPEIKSVVINLSQGSLKQTHMPSDLAIEGKGYFQVESRSGEKMYTRSLSLRINSGGNISDQHGNKISGVTANIDTNRDIMVQQDGTVVVRDEDGAVTVIGKLMVMDFRNPQGLLSVENGYYKAAPNAGSAFENNEHVKIIQENLETGNVDFAEQITGSMADEIALKANIKAIKTQDEMLGDIIDLQG